jgi:N-acetylglucosaminyldiphosphoundecaprenol N-acetyl-beta-D-mannosaminyltransferase
VTDQRDAARPDVRSDPPASPLPRIDIVGTAVHAVDVEQAAAYLRDALWHRRRAFVITANPEFVVLARREPKVRAAAERADLVVADGVGLVLASRILRRPLPGRARGRDLVLRLAADAQRLGLSMYLLGAREGVAERAAAALRRVQPGLRIAGTFAGSPAAADDGTTVGRVRSAFPDILLVAYGMPHQELWIVRNMTSLPTARVVMGVGGAFDYLAGDAPLPPGWVARSGFEWLWRLAHQRWRWRRQLALPLFLMLVLRERIRAR